MRESRYERRKRREADCVEGQRKREGMCERNVGNGDREGKVGRWRWDGYWVKRGRAKNG